MEVKASRSEGNWQSHGPRGGWFVWVQFALDERIDVAVFDRDPTQIQAVMVAELSADDWSWQPAAEGRIRSGTASVMASGKAKLRAGAVWIAPPYLGEHQRLLAKARRDAFSRSAEATVLGILATAPEGMTASQASDLIAPALHLNAEEITNRVKSAIRSLTRQGMIVAVSRGVYRSS